MAAHCVFETNELLEQILLRLPMKQILRTRAVSGHWKRLIEVSLPLKQATFRATKDGRVLTIDSKIEESAMVPVDARFAVPIMIFPPNKIVINPVFPWHITELQCPGPQPLDWRRYEVANVVTMFALHFATLPPTGFSSIYGEMFVTQPPCTALYVAIGRESSSRKMVSGLPVTACLQDRNGITISSLLRTFEDMISSLNEADISQGVSFHARFALDTVRFEQLRER